MVAAIHHLSHQAILCTIYIYQSSSLRENKINFQISFLASFLFYCMYTENRFGKMIAEDLRVDSDAFLISKLLKKIKKINKYFLI